MSQREYREMFDEVKVSDEKLDEIEKAMTQETMVRRRPSMKKVVVLAACMMMLLSVGVVAAEAIVQAVKEYQIERVESEYTGIDEEVRNEMKENGTIVLNEMGRNVVYNEVTTETKSIIIMVNGEPLEYEIDITPYVKANGIALGTFAEDLMDIEFYEEIRQLTGVTGALSGGWDLDEEKRLSVTILSEDDPRNDIGWYYRNMENGDVYLMVPKTVEFDTDVELYYFEHTYWDEEGKNDYVEREPGILIPELEEKEVKYYNFTYGGKKYAVGLWWEKGAHIGFPDYEKMYSTAVIELKEDSTEK